MIRKLALSAVSLVIGGLIGFNLPSKSMAQNQVSGPVDFTAQWQAAFAANDFDALRDLYEADAWLMAQGQPARKGSGEIINYLKALSENGMTADVQTTEENLIVDGNYTFSTTQWGHEYTQANGDTVIDAGRSFVVFKRGKDGKWRLWRAVKNQSPDVVFRTSQNELE